MSKTQKPSFTLELTAQPDPVTHQRVWDGLADYNLQFAGPDNHQLMDIYLRDEAGELGGGLLGGTAWGWLYIQILWVRADLRGQGCGQALMAAAEAEAMRRGCHHAYVDTINFQAPGFYEKLGYTVWGVLEGMPPGHRRIFYRKDLL